MEVKDRSNLGRAIAEPGTLAEQRANYSLLAADPSNGSTSEGNLLSLKTLLSLHKDNKEIKKAIEATVLEESRWTTAAMMDLHNSESSAYSLGEYYGRDLQGALELGKLYKRQTDEYDLRSRIEPS